MFVAILLGICEEFKSLFAPHTKLDSSELDSPYSVVNVAELTIVFIIILPPREEHRTKMFRISSNLLYEKTYFSGKL